MSLLSALILWFGIDAQATCVTSEEILEVISEFEDSARSSIESLSKPLSITYQPSTMPISAYISFNDLKKIEVRVSGSLCRDEFSKDDLRFLLCHELGHAAGGPPFMDGIGWRQSGLNISAEGQADYYAASRCLPKIFADPDNREFLKNPSLHPELKNLCRFKSESDRAICSRIILAGLGFLKHTHEVALEFTQVPPLNHPGAPPSLEARSRFETEQTLLRQYPSSQCRLDTVVAAIQNKERPSCWYKKMDSGNELNYY